MSNVFCPVPKTHEDFIEHVSKNIMENKETPEDFEATLAYILYKMPVRKREIFLAIERDNIPVRTIGIKYSVSGQRIHDINKNTIATLKEKYGRMLSIGMAKYIAEEKQQSKVLGETNTRNSYYKLGYSDGYADGKQRRKQMYFSRTSLNSITLDDLSLPYRAEHFLSVFGLTDASKIVNKGDDIMKIPNIGRSSLFELFERLLQFDIDVYEYFPRTIKKFKFSFGGSEG